jgi:integrase
VHGRQSPEFQKRMASISRLPSGLWRVQVRRKGQSTSKSFRLKTDAERWANEQEDRAYRGQTVTSAQQAKTGTLADLIQLHFADHAKASKPIGRTKRYSLEKMERDIGQTRVADLTKQRIIEYGIQRSAEGAGPATLTVDLAHLHTVLDTATCVHDVQTDLDALRHARMALTKLGYVAKSVERDRRPTLAELEQLIEHFLTKKRQIIPLHLIIPFAVGSAMRQEEITKIDLRDLEPDKRIIKIWSRKDPRKKASISSKRFDAILYQELPCMCVHRRVHADTQVIEIAAVVVQCISRHRKFSIADLTLILHPG